MRLTLDGAPVEPVTVAAPDAAGDVAVSGALSVEPGDHVAVLEVEDAVGGRLERRWSFRSTDRAVTRLAGNDRFGTAAAVSAATFPSAGSADGAVLARADDFADAISGVPLAAAVGGPLLLAAPDGLPPAVAEELRRGVAPGSTVHLLGGTAALGERVVRDVEALGFDVERLSGSDRFATAAAVAAELPASAEVFLASGSSFPDALAASAPAARDGIPILLSGTDDLPDATVAALERRGASRVTLIGGAAVLGERIEQQAGAIADEVDRVAGPDRYATAAAVLAAFYDAPPTVSLASGAAFPDALSGTLHAASLGHPLLLTTPEELAAPAAEAARAHRWERMAVYGGSSAVADAVVAAAVRAAEDGPRAPLVVSTSPAAGTTVTGLDPVTVALDRPVDPLRSTVHVEVAGAEVPGAIAETGMTGLLTVRIRPGAPLLAPGAAAPGRLVIAAFGVEGDQVHEDLAFTYVQPDPVFAAAGDVPLHLPSRRVELIGFHQSSRDGARQLEPRGSAIPMLTLPIRGRGTGSRTAADVVSAPGEAVLAPVTGRVVRAGPYALYCRHPDQFAVIEPDAHLGWEVKVLHFEGLAVSAGDRVVASETVLGSGPRTLPFRSQVDDFSAASGPHVHVEVVDPSIPDRPSGGC